MDTSVVKKVENVWILRVEKDNGKVQEYRCATEAQAKKQASVLVPKDEN